MGLTIPSSHLDLLQKPNFGDLATLGPGGAPQVTPVWVDWDGTHVVVNTARGRVKDRNLSRDGRVALSVLDATNPYRYLTVQGRVVSSTEEGADAHIDRMAKKYLNMEVYPYRQPGEVRVLYKIMPEKIHAYG